MSDHADVLWVALCEAKPPTAKAFVRYALAKVQERAIRLSFMERMAESVRLSVDGMRYQTPWTWKRSEPRAEIDVDAVVADIVDRAGLEVLDGPA